MLCFDQPPSENERVIRHDWSRALVIVFEEFNHLDRNAFTCHFRRFHGDNMPFFEEKSKWNTT